MGDTSTNFEIDDPGGGARIAGVAGSPGAAADTVLTSDGTGGTSWASGGGSQPGAAIVRGPFSFAFNAAGLAAGVAVGYTPAINDVLIGAWIEADTPFDGTTPMADFGVGCNDGDPGILTQLTAPGAPWDLTQQTVVIGDQVGSLAPAPYPTFLAVRFTAANPMQLWVTQDGTKNGDTPAGSTGAAKLYLVTASPTA